MRQEQRRRKGIKKNQIKMTSDEETPKKLMPKLSFLDGIKKFISEVLIGMD